MSDVELSYFKSVIDECRECESYRWRQILDQRCIALLGKRDMPTDAIEEYCRYLAAALLAYDIHVEIRRVPWEIYGWQDSLKALHLQSVGWRNRWVLIQYTALSWSSRGFPRNFLHVLNVLRSAGAQIAIVYHDVEPFPCTRLIDRLRRLTQVRIMSYALRRARLAIFTVPMERLSWLPRFYSNAHFIPIGPNLPIPDDEIERDGLGKFLDGVINRTATPVVSIYSITGGAAGVRETQLIISAVRQAVQKLGKLRLLVFGRYADLRESLLRDGFQGLPVTLSVEGVLEPHEVFQRLTGSDVLLFVRGPISTRRGSAIAGIACSLPIIAYSGSETAPPITEAGVVLVSPDHPEELNAALIHVLSDSAYRKALATRSRAAYQAHFAWPVIAGQFNALLKNS
jgi:glycosyltransferase involved in cell wall biosynthesis